ncbi:hypothetical protein MCHI_000418 [Candidatus Magnetoovum chiemensis]|nr:hypothetical protein MCHI_000418 [Candidatus Magnetoovum chiemensis]
MESMHDLVQWIVELNKTNHVGYAFLTIGIMASLGGLIGAGIELFFKALGIKSNKIEINH